MVKEGKENSKVEEFVNSIDELQEVGKLTSVRPDERHDKKAAADKAVEAAQKGLREYGYKIAKEEGYEVPENPEEIDPEVLSAAVKLGQVRAKNKGESAFYNNLDEILNEEIPESALERLALSEEIRENAQDKASLDTYLSYKSLEQLGEYYKTNKKARNKDEEGLLRSIMIQGVIQEKREKVKDESRDVQELSLALAERAAKAGYIKTEDEEKYTLKGLVKSIEEAKKRYLPLQSKLYGTVRETIKNMARGSREDFDKSVSLTYGAIKDQTKVREYKKAT